MRRPIIMAIIAFVTVASLSSTSPTNLETINNWSHHLIVIINNTYSSQELTDYQVAVNLNYENFNFLQAQHDGADLQFCNQNGDVLPHWIENYDSLDERAKIWVKVDTIAPSDFTYINMYYGNPAAVDGSDFDMTFTKDSVLNGLVALWHMDEGSGATITDASGNGNDGIFKADNEPAWTGADGGTWGGKAKHFGTGDSLYLDGVDDYLSISSVSDDINSDTVFAFWIKGRGPFFTACRSDIYRDYFSLMHSEDGCIHATFKQFNNLKWCIKTVHAYPSDEWLFIVLGHDGSEPFLYVNGTLAEITFLQSSQGLLDKTVYFDIFKTPTRSELGAFRAVGNPYDYFLGEIDEVRIYNRALLPGEITALYERRKYTDLEPSVIITSEYKGTDWPMFMHNPQHTGYSPSKMPQYLKEAWNSLVYPTAGSSLRFAASEGKLFVIQDSQKFFSLNIDDGSLLLNIGTGGYDCLDSFPAAAEGRVYISTNGSVQCFDTDTGTRLWIHNRLASWISNEAVSSPIIVDGYVFVGGMLTNWSPSVEPDDPIYQDVKKYGEKLDQSSKRVVCLDAVTGELIWEFYGRGYISNTPAYCNEEIFINDVFGRIYCLCAKTGRANWGKDLGKSSWTSVSVDGERLLVDVDGILNCIELKTGGTLWKFPHTCLPFKTHALAYSKVFVGSGDGVLYCLDAESGVVLWSIKTEMITCSPIVADKKVAFGTVDGKVYIVDAQTGNLITSHSFESYIQALVLSDGKLIVGEDNGKISCFEESTKALDTSAKELPFETIAKGYYGRLDERKNYVIRDNEDLRNLKDKGYSLPDVNFAHYMIIAVFQDAMAIGDSSISVSKVIETETELQVFVKEIWPGEECEMTDALSQPYHIIKTQRVEKEVIFITDKEIMICPPSREKGTLSGRVIDPDSGRGISGVIVHLSPPRTETLSYMSSRLDGRFTFFNLDPGVYSVRAYWTNGFAMESHDSTEGEITVKAGETSTTTIELGSSGNHSEITRVSINGGEDVPVVGPGEKISVEIEFIYWRHKSCPNCIMYFPVGIGSGPQDSIFGGIPGVYPGSRIRGIVYLTAPSKPGGYSIHITDAATSNEKESFETYRNKHPEEVLYVSYIRVIEEAKEKIATRNLIYLFSVLTITGLLGILVIWVFIGMRRSQKATLAGDTERNQERHWK